jgi:hypothetical protein
MRQETKPDNPPRARTPTQVVAKRSTPSGSPSATLRVLARDCTEEPLVQRATRRSASRLDQWNKGMPLAPLT